MESDEKFASEFLVSDGPVNPKTDKPYGKATKAYQEWVAEQVKPVISMEDFALMVKMRDAVHAHPVAKDLLASGVAEGTIRTTWDDEPVQCRLDWFDPERNLIVDLKTCNDIDRFRFDIRDFGYIEQMAFYNFCVSLARGDTIGIGRRPECYLIAVEKKEPYRVAVVHIVQLTILDAISNHMGGESWRDDANAMIRELKKCRETGIWPTRYEDVINI